MMLYILHFLAIILTTDLDHFFFENLPYCDNSRIKVVVRISSSNVNVKSETDKLFFDTALLLEISIIDATELRSSRFIPPIQLTTNRLYFTTRRSAHLHKEIKKNSFLYNDGCEIYFSLREILVGEEIPLIFQEISPRFVQEKENFGLILEFLLSKEDLYWTAELTNVCLHFDSHCFKDMDRVANLNFH